MSLETLTYNRLMYDVINVAVHDNSKQVRSIHVHVLQVAIVNSEYMLNANRRHAPKCKYH